MKKNLKNSSIKGKRKNKAYKRILEMCPNCKTFWDPSENYGSKIDIDGCPLCESMKQSKRP